MSDSRSDDELMLAFGRGDGRAFEALYQRYRKPMYRYLVHAVGDRVVADDLYQEVWSRIIDARRKFRAGAGFRRWAFRIAHNRLVDHWRARGREPGSDTTQLELQPAAEHGAPDSMVDAEQRARQLRAALMQLPPEQREAFLLQREAGLTLDQIADREQVGRETIKSRLRYAVGKLRTLLDPGPEAAGK
jgi:RNA polymerase sigma-70 factor (ECF subfamily)